MKDLRLFSQVFDFIQYTRHSPAFGYISRTSPIARRKRLEPAKPPTTPPVWCYDGNTCYLCLKNLTGSRILCKIFSFLFFFFSILSPPLLKNGFISLFLLRYS